MKSRVILLDAIYKTAEDSRCRKA